MICIEVEQRGKDMRGIWMMIVGAILLQPAVAGTHAHSLQPKTEIASVEPVQIDDFSSKTVTIHRRDDGFYAHATVSGVPMDFFIDTGATYVTISTKDLKRLGGKAVRTGEKDESEDLTGKVLSVGIRLPDIQIGPISLKKVDAQFVQQGSTVNLLGLSFLTRLTHVELRRDIMVLSQ